MASYVTHEELFEVLNGHDERLNKNFDKVNKRLDGVELMLCTILTPAQRRSIRNIAPDLGPIIDRIEG